MSLRSVSRLELALAFLLGLLAAPGRPLAQPAGQAPLALERCRISDASGTVSVEARCGSLSVAEDPADAAGPRIDLAVAVIPAIATRARPDPLFLLAGGPGQGAREGYVATLGAFAGLRRERDLVLVDQRGTGGSNRLDCDMPEESWQAGEFSPEEAARLARDCLAALPGRPQFYTTSLAVRDLDAVRAALGYERINLFGSSYGTRVAQHYLRRYPERVRTVVLDSVVPPGLALGPEIALTAQRALDAAFGRCAADAACNERFPALPARFRTLLERLRSAPVTVTMPDPVSGAPREVEVADGHVVLAARMLAYSAPSASLIPYLVHEAGSRGNLAPLAAQAEMARAGLSRMLATGMHHSVVCAEDAPGFADAVDRAALAESFIGTAMYEAMEAICRAWPRGPVDPDFGEPLDSAVPALLLSGDADPATPAAYGARAAEGFREGLHLVFAGQGHNQIRLPCAQRIVRQFVEAGTTAGLDASCVDTVRPAPFFLSASGPAP